MNSEDRHTTAHQYTLSGIKLIDAAWSGVSRPLNASTEDNWQTVWGNESNGEVRALRPQQLPEGHTPEPRILWETLKEAAARPLQGKPGLARTLYVEDALTCAFLKDKLAQDLPPQDFARIKVEVNSSTTVAQALEAADRRLGGAVGYLSRPDSSLDTLRDFFTATARWAEEEPWKAMDDTEMVMIEGLDESPLLACIMGAGSCEQGLALFSSPEQVQAFMEDPAQVRLFFQYTDAHTAGPGVAAEIDTYRLTIHNEDMIPVAACPSDTGDYPFVSAWELRLLMDSMETLDLYMEQELNLSPGKSDVPLKLSDGREVKVSSWRHRGDKVVPCAESLGSGKPGRNDPCPCGSGKKYKKCCGNPLSMLE